MTSKVLTKKVLVVEDDAPTLKAVMIKLGKAGIENDSASNGEEALLKIRQNKYKLVLLDLRMPKKDGFEVIKEIRADKKLKAVKILVFTNLGQKDDCDRVMELGGNWCLVKANIPIEELINKVVKLAKK